MRLRFSCVSVKFNIYQFKIFNFMFLQLVVKLFENAQEHSQLHFCKTTVIKELGPLYVSSICSNNRAGLKKCMYDYQYTNENNGKFKFVKFVNI